MNACPRCGASDASGRLSVCPRCLLADLAGDAPADGSDDALPQLGVATLTLEAELGRGGMGRVFRARDERLGRAVAVKVLKAEIAADPDYQHFRARFAREARTLARLEHPGIVAVHDFGTTVAGDAYLVMQLVSGGSLAGRLPLPIAEAIDVARQVCEALAYAHGRGVVHRDIKPENVLIGDDGRVRLSDFGIARLLEPAPGDGREDGPDARPLTRPSLVLGTPGYMAPEVRTGTAADPRADVFAVGALLAHMLTGRHPDGAPQAGLPPALAPVIARATAFDPVRRTPSADALARELADAATRIRATPAATDELPPEERTWRGAVALLAAVATAVVLYAGVVSLTPRAMSADDAVPFTVFGDQKLGDGRILTRARFEVWPTLGAALAIAIALATYGLLRRHWRTAGVERHAPDRPLIGARRLLRLGVGLFALFLLHQLVAHTPAAAALSYIIPVIAGSLELVMVYLFWDAVLEAQQTHRSLAREPLLWLGLALSLVPPTYHMALLAATFAR